MSNTLPALSERDERAYRANLGLYVAYSTLQSFQLWLPIWIVYLQQQRHLSLTQITLLDMPFFLTQVISEVPTGAIADRFGRKTSLLLGAAFATVGIGVFGIAGNYSVIVISYVFWGVGMTLQSGADQAFLYDTLKILGRETEYSRIFGRATAVTIVASIVAGLLGAPLAAATTLATPVLVSAFIFAASAVVALTFKEPPPQEQRLSYVATIRTGLTEVGRRPVIRTVIIFGVASSLCFLLPQYFQQPYLKQHGVSTAALGLFLMPARAVSAMVSVGTHRIEARIGARSAIAIMPVLCLAVCAVLAGWGSLWAFALVPVAAGSQHGALAPDFELHQRPHRQRPARHHPLDQRPGHGPGPGHVLAGLRLPGRPLLAALRLRRRRRGGHRAHAHALHPVAPRRGGRAARSTAGLRGFG